MYSTDIPLLHKSTSQLMYKHPWITCNYNDSLSFSKSKLRSVVKLIYASMLRNLCGQANLLGDPAETRICELTLGSQALQPLGHTADAFAISVISQ